MKSFTLFISAAIVASSAAINEPVASPTAAVERELAEYERQLGTDVTGTPTATPGRPTSGVSTSYFIYQLTFFEAVHQRGRPLRSDLRRRRMLDDPRLSMRISTSCAKLVFVFIIDLEHQVR